MVVEIFATGDREIPKESDGHKALFVSVGALWKKIRSIHRVRSPHFLVGSFGAAEPAERLRRRWTTSRQRIQLAPYFPSHNGICIF